MAKINLAADKQRAAANIIDVDANKFYFLGVSGKAIYGILNDPNLTATIAPAATGTGGDTRTWSTKTTRQRYDDILLLFARLVSQTAGLVDEKSPLVLAMSPAIAVDLAQATDFNVSVMTMLKSYFTNISIVSAPPWPSA